MRRTLPWSRSLPHAWTTRSLARLTATGGGFLTDGDWIESPYIQGDGNRLIQTGNIGVGSYREQGFRYISDESFDQLRCTEVLPGDLLICRLGDPVSRSCLAPDLGVRMLTSVDVCIARLTDGADHRYFNYVLSSSPYLEWVSAQVRGSTRDRISRSMLAHFPLPCPPTEVQREIAQFLDYETAEIDAFIADQERLIDLLTERRNSVVIHAVNVGTIDTPIKRACRISAGVGFPLEFQGDSGQEIPFFKVGSLAHSGEGGNLGPPLDTVSIETAVKLGAKIHPPGSCLMAKIGAALLLRRVGVSPVRCCIDNNLIALTARQGVDSEFLRLALLAVDPLAHLNPGAVPNIDMRSFRDSKIWLPSLEVQREIVARVNRECAAVNRAIGEAREAIALSRERRAALISAAVTGQIDVRGWNRPVSRAV